MSVDAATTPFSIILTNSGETKRTESYISDTVNVYLTTQTDKKYSSKEVAEEAMGVSSGEKETNTGEKETTGSNTDLDYNVDLKGAGANLPYTTYEAEYYIIDFIECEMAENALKKPGNMFMVMYMIILCIM